jgi:hypothetical protein
MARSSASSRTLTDHDEIRQWAEERDAKPARVEGTGNGDDIGMIRLDFPGYSGEGSLEEISWDEWFDKFDERNLVLLVQDETASGEQSNFNKLVSRENAKQTRSSSANRHRPNRSESRTTSRVSEGKQNRQARGRSLSQSATSRKARTTDSSGQQRSSQKTNGRSNRQSSVRATAKQSSGQKKTQTRSSRSSSTRGSQSRKRAA